MEYLRRSAKRKDKATSKRPKSAVMPGAVSFKLHTEVLAEKRKLQHEEKEVAHLLNTQRRILGRKTVEDFARFKLVRRETAATRSRSLHCNGNTSKSRRSTDHLLEVDDRSPQRRVHMESRPLLSARLATSEMVSNSLPRRPQSAKPVLQSQYRSTPDRTTQFKETELVEKRSTARSSSSTKKKKKKKTSDRKSELLIPSLSAPVLADTQTLPICKKINIVVNMRNLKLLEEESPIDVPPVISREAWGDL